eukprot:6172773-Pleurochrysis_carterae.AAC.1
MKELSRGSRSVSRYYLRYIQVLPASEAALPGVAMLECKFGARAQGHYGKSPRKLDDCTAETDDYMYQHTYWFIPA